MNHEPGSPLPWKYDGTSGDWGIVMEKELPYHDPIVLCGEYDSSSPDTGDANYIIHACNSYPMLVAALKRIATDLMVHDLDGCMELAGKALQEVGEL